MSDLLPVLAAAMLCACPPPGGPDTGPRPEREPPEESVEWRWLLPAVLAILSRWG